MRELSLLLILKVGIPFKVIDIMLDVELCRWKRLLRNVIHEHLPFWHCY